VSIDFSIVLPHWLPLLQGLGVTALITGTCAVLGSLCGFAMSLARSSPMRVLCWPASLYVEFFRGTPLLIQLFWVYFCLPIVFGISLRPITAVGITLVFYMTAMTCETFRGALKSIEREQYDACTALGLNGRVRVLYVVFPQVVLRAIPPLLSNVVALFKESALISSVGVADLMFVGDNLSNSTARPIEFLTAVALIYFAVAFPFTRLVGVVEKRFLVRFT